jgi:hypothetical protein
MAKARSYPSEGCVCVARLKLMVPGATQREQPEHLFTWLIVFQTTNRKGKCQIVVAPAYTAEIVVQAPVPGTYS